MRIARALAVSAMVLGVSIGMMLAQGPPGGGGGGKGKGKGGFNIPAPITLKVAGYADGGAIPDSVGCVGGQKDTPKIDWTGAPADTAAFALIMHDTDVAINGSDVLHWAIYDIPGTATGLPAGVPKMAELADGSKQLNHVAGMPGFYSPCPPAPTVHHYTIELYALDAKLGLPTTTSRADLTAALGMHTRAKGTYVGTYHQ
jgi:Raf kinase inhibitor-like YbhB/YbcL family protein